MNFHGLHFGMSRAAVRALYPQARTTPLIDGRDPVTGKRVIVGGNELVPQITTVAGIPINATVSFEDDAAAQIDLSPDGAGEEATLLLAARRLARALGLDGLVEIPEKRAWEHEGTLVFLYADNGFRFELMPR
jgi:hypothetical protein